MAGSKVDRLVGGDKGWGPVSDTLNLAAARATLAALTELAETGQTMGVNGRVVRLGDKGENFLNRSAVGDIVDEHIKVVSAAVIAKARLRRG